MRFYAEIIGLPENIFILLRELIQERTGLYYDNSKREILADKLSPLIIERGFSSALDYYYFLKYDTEAEQEWTRIIGVLTVQETFFWREMDQIHSLTNNLLPEYEKKGLKGTVRIWSAACATGEEPLTIAIALNEAGWFNRLPIEIYASDASVGAVKRAKEGLFKERSFRNLSIELRNKYFEKEQEQWRIDPAIFSRVRWSVVNLMVQAEVEPLARSPFIFCRNVFIYFSQDGIRKTVALFARSMPQNGKLFVAASESLLRVTTEFELEEIGGAFVYIKK